MRVDEVALSMTTKFLLLLLFSTVLSSCSANSSLTPPRAPDLPYRTWEIGLIAPHYMEVWVESVDVVDRRGVVYSRVHGGTASIANPPGNRGTPSGWPRRPGAGKTRPMTGIDLPKHIDVLWQSLVEPQTYSVGIDLPEWVRIEMLSPRRIRCRFNGNYIEDYRKVVTIGLAPGGIAKAWLIGDCAEPIEIGRFEGSVHSQGPSQGQTDGRYALPLAPEAQHYLDTHEIPFESW